MKTLLGHFDKLVKEEKEKNKKLLEIVESQKAGRCSVASCVGSIESLQEARRRFASSVT